jgi:hypothetical protein
MARVMARIMMQPAEVMVFEAFQTLTIAVEQRAIWGGHWPTVPGWGDHWPTVPGWGDHQT